MAFDHQAHHLGTPLIHIGFPKALSSWMQKSLFKPEQGFINVLDSLHTTIGLIDPTPFCFDEALCIRFIEEALKKNAGTNNLVPVCSAEALIGNPYCGGYNAKQNADRLKQLFPDARILLIVREQRQLMRSLYKTMVVWGMPHSIKRLLNPKDTSLAPQFNLDFLRFDLATAYYQQLFGRDNVLVMPYEAFIDDPKHFMLTILQHAQCSPTPAFERLPWKKRVNKNQPLISLYLQRLRNLLLSSPFNYAGPLASTEAQVHKRIKRSKNNSFPAFTNNWFEDDFRQTVSTVFSGQFAASNTRLQQLTGLDLAAYGYEITDTHS
ncbi:MAG TPA: sulfotransferase [Pseudomonadales bacterium]|nr:sulfotransferase [Pseudomonadales bacterium]